MAKRRPSQEEEGGSWMDTYGDMITLVLTFFVLLYSMSSMDVSKWQYIAEAFSKAKISEPQVQVIGKPNPENDPSAIYDDTIPEVEDYDEIVDFEDFFMYLKEVITTNNLQESVSVEMSNTGVYMRFRDNIFFAGDSDVLLDEGKYILDIISDGIRSVNERIHAIKVSGHTAGAANSDANEWTLSSGRATSVINYMLSLDACDPEKFSAAGYGKYRPVDTNDTEEGRRQNRRVEIVFVRNDVDFTDPEVIQELFQMEYGTDFVQYSDSDGTVPETNTAVEDVPEVDAERTDPDRVYVSKEDVLSAE
ncbi:MAG: flagellar motor protein MotB [Oscillospiraceae bacterium]|nr:flagellar motor protein MotB [Oscillospiraceae bacterium]